MLMHEMHGSAVCVGVSFPERFTLRCSIVPLRLYVTEITCLQARIRQCGDRHYNAVKSGYVSRGKNNRPPVIAGMK